MRWACLRTSKVSCRGSPRRSSRSSAPERARLLNYCHLHCIYFTRRMFLQYAYLPVLDSQQIGVEAKGACKAYHAHKSLR